MFRCSECGRVVGPFLDKFGRPEMFKCWRTGEAAQTVPQFLPAKKTPKRPKDVDAVDLSRRAKKELQWT